jgi:hypothetical protein
MATVDMPDLLSDRETTMADARATKGSARPYGAFDELDRLSRWDVLIEATIARWERDPSAIEDDGVTPPTRAALSRARWHAVLLRNSGANPPSRIVPTGDGGVSVEFGPLGDCDCFEFRDTGLDVLYYRNHRLTRLDEVAY